MVITLNVVITVRGSITPALSLEHPQTIDSVTKSTQEMKQFLQQTPINNGSRNAHHITNKQTEHPTMASFCPTITIQ